MINNSVYWIRKFLDESMDCQHGKVKKFFSVLSFAVWCIKALSKPIVVFFCSQIVRSFTSRHVFLFTDST